MQSRRLEDEFMSVSPTAREISRKHRYELGSDQFPISRRYGSPRAGIRSPTPQREVDRSRRVLVRDRRSGSIETMMPYGLHMGGGGSGRFDKAHSPSPPFHQVEERHHFDDEIVHRNYEGSRRIRFDANDNSRLKQVYGYDHDTSRTSKQRDYSENMIDVMDGREMLPQRTMHMEDETVRKPSRLSPDLGPFSNYLGSGKGFLSSSQSMVMSQFKHDKHQYPEQMPMDKLPVMEPYKAEEPILSSRDDTYTMVPACYSKDFANSSGISGDEVMDAYKIGEPTGFDAYGRKLHIDSGIDLEIAPRKGAFSPTRVEREDHFFPKSRRIINDDDGYRSGTIHRTMTSHSQIDYDHRLMDYDHRDVSRSSVMHPVFKRDEIVEDSRERLCKDSGIDPEVRLQKSAFSSTRVEHKDNFPKSQRITNDEDDGYQSGAIHRIMHPHSQLDYDHRHMDHDDRDLSRSTVLHPVLERGEIVEDSHGNRNESRIWNHHALQKPTITDYMDITRTSKQKDGYLGSGSTRVHYERRVSRDHELLEMGTSHDRLDTYLRSAQGFARDASSGNQKERPLKVTPMASHEVEVHRHAIRTHKMEELGTYETADRVLKRKYRMEEDIKRHESKSIKSSKWTELREYEDLRDGDDHWTNEDMGDTYPCRPMGFDYDYLEETTRRHRHNHIDYAYDDLPPSIFSLEHSERHSVQSYKHGNGNTNTKGHARHGSSSWYDSNNFNRSVLHKQHNVWKRIDGYHDGPSKLQAGAARSEPSEEADEFMKLVHEAFLKYSKKLNMNPAVRRRYLEQGKAGSLFCIVCGSFSKEFMDTRRLGTHAFMSHKAGMRIEHMGLLKAICVLLGWNNVISPGTITWAPEVLPDAEAVAQKEDLIIWPPIVIIHNISPLNRNHQAQKAASADRLEAFLRRKGFGARQFKVCKGNPQDESIMVVEFPRTFTGLENAERLHKYFADDKRGRVDVKDMSTSRAGSKMGRRREEGNMEELVLCGYIGIVEDLEKLDRDTKMISCVKSKKEILNLANAPAKLER